MLGENTSAKPAHPQMSIETMMVFLRPTLSAIRPATMAPKNMPKKQMDE